MQIIKESKLEMELLGKTITHRYAGKAIVVGYSSESGEPVGFFYADQEIRCFSHKDIICVGE